MPGAYQCPRCGAGNPREAAFCSNCGDQLQAGAVDPTVLTSPPTPSRTEPDQGRPHYTAAPVPWTAQVQREARRPAGTAVTWAAGILIAFGTLFGVVGLLFQGVAGGLQVQSEASAEIAYLAAGSGALGATLLGLALLHVVLGIMLIAQPRLWISLSAAAMSSASALIASALLVWALYQDMETWQLLLLALLLIGVTMSLCFVAYASLTEFRRANGTTSE